MPNSLDQKLDGIDRHPFRATFRLRGREWATAEPSGRPPCDRTCCRTCVQRWHRIRMGRELSEAEHAYVVEVLCRWIEREAKGPEPAKPEVARALDYRRAWPV